MSKAPITKEEIYQSKIEKTSAMIARVIKPLIHENQTLKDEIKRLKKENAMLLFIYRP